MRLGEQELGCKNLITLQSYYLSLLGPIFFKPIN